MGRPVWIEYPGSLYHITSRGNEKKEIFLADEDRAKFLNILREYHARYGILVHAYVLLDNYKFFSFFFLSIVQGLINFGGRGI